jgi:hypothetical protein
MNQTLLLLYLRNNKLPRTLLMELLWLCRLGFFFLFQLENLIYYFFVKQNVHTYVRYT